MDVRRLEACVAASPSIEVLPYLLAEDMRGATSMGTTKGDKSIRSCDEVFPSFLSLPILVTPKALVDAALLNLPADPARKFPDDIVGFSCTGP